MIRVLQASRGRPGGIKCTREIGNRPIGDNSPDLAVCRRASALAVAILCRIILYECRSLYELCLKVAHYGAHLGWLETNHIQELDQELHRVPRVRYISRLDEP